MENERCNFREQPVCDHCGKVGIGFNINGRESTCYIVCEREECGNCYFIEFDRFFSSNLSPLDWMGQIAEKPGMPHEEFFRCCERLREQTKTYNR